MLLVAVTGMYVRLQLSVRQSVSGIQDFHGRYYHPSNARFWFYGDDPADERLSLLSKYLDEFEARPVDSTVHPQPLRQVPPHLPSTKCQPYKLRCRLACPKSCYLSNLLATCV